MWSPNADIGIKPRTLGDVGSPCFSSRVLKVLVLAPVNFGHLRAVSQAIVGRASMIGEQSVKIRKAELVAELETNMCAHIACFCSVPIGEQFCCELCREAGREGIEVACQCDHSACPVTARHFIPYVAA